MGALSRRRKANENSLQKDIVDYINSRPEYNCRLTRIKNGGTFDPVAKVFRSNSTEKGIPDLIGCKAGRAVYIEVKLPCITDRRAYQGTLSKEQKAYLEDMKNRGAIVGIAYDVQDAIEIITDDPEIYPRKDRTFGPRRFLAQGTKYEQKKKPETLSSLDLIRIAAERARAKDGDDGDPDEC